jgi:hypothetical protein
MNRGDLLEQSREHSAYKFKSMLLYLLLTLLIIYIAVPTYGIIRDTVGPGETVFMLSSPLPEARLQRPGHGILEKIHAFFFPSQEVPVPVLQRIDLKGRVIYTDTSPFVHGLIRLESEPRYTRTDADGYFIFLDVAEGPHTISVLDEVGNVLAKCEILIERAPDLENMPEAKDVRLIRLSDGTFVFQVAVDIKVLEITLFLKRDADGNLLGPDRIELGLVQTGTLEPLQPGIPPPSPPEPGAPGDPEIPVKPGGKIPDGGDSGPGLSADRFNFDVFDTVTAVPYGQTGAVSVNIFGAKKRIAPGMKGSYHFTVDNGRNEDPSRYNVTFTAVDTLPATHKIPMRYRLQADGVYVAGGAAAWCTPAGLYQEAVLAGGKHVKYVLEWHWLEGEKDNEYARFGGDPDFSYSLHIRVTAQKQ